MTALDNGAAVRRRERRLLGGLRHEQINVAMKSGSARSAALRGARRPPPEVNAIRSGRPWRPVRFAAPRGAAHRCLVSGKCDGTFCRTDGGCVLVDEPEDAVDVVEDVVDAPGPTAKLTLDVFVSQFRKEFGRTGSMCCGRHGGDNSARFSSRSMEECRTHGHYHCACHMQRSTNQWLHQIL